MLRLMIALFVAVIGVLLQGLLYLSINGIVVLISIPFLFFFKLFNNRPTCFSYFGVLGGFFGGASALHAYFYVPTSYYYHLWGWPGIAIGIIGGILFPTQIGIFFVLSIIYGTAATYMIDFFSALCFGIAGLILYTVPFTVPSWFHVTRKVKNLFDREHSIKNPEEL